VYGVPVVPFTLRTLSLIAPRVAHVVPAGQVVLVLPTGANGQFLP
jgi:cytochrome P450